MNVNPQEYQTLQNLQAALAAGLDPSMGMDIFNQTTGQAYDRHQQNRANTQSQLGHLNDLAAQLSSQGSDPAAIQSAIASQAQQLPNSPYAEKGLGALMSMIPQMGGLDPSSPAGGGSAVSGQDIQFVDQKVQDILAAAQDPTAGQVSLDQTKQLLASMYGATGATPQQIKEIQDYATTAWQTYGGPMPAEVAPVQPVSSAPGIWGDANPDTAAWQGNDPSFFDKVIGAPRSLMDDILSMLG